jgi:hypothetical protein
MTNKTTDLKTVRRTHRRWMRAAGWTLVMLGVVVSWVWSVELAILGESVNAAIAGAATLLLFCAGIILIWRVSPHRGRRATFAFRAVVIASAVGAIVAGIVPVAVVAANTGTVTADLVSGTTGDGYRISGMAVVTSDEYHQTTLDLTVSASDRTAPLIMATVSFADGTADMTCANTRQTWIHDISTVVLTCNTFTPIASLEEVDGIAVTAR